MAPESLLEGEINEVEKNLRSELRELLSPSRKTLLIILFAGFFISYVSLLHGMNEVWAWEVAKSLITINGLILGFAILGATFLSRRGFTRTAYKAMIEESLDKVMKRAAEYGEGSKVTVEEFMKREFLPIITAPAYTMGLIRGTFETSVKQILVSVALALCLFGISDTTADILSLRLLFISIYIGAIVFFIWGAYMVLRVTFVLVGIGARAYIRGTYELIEESLEKRAKNFEKHKEKG